MINYCIYCKYAVFKRINNKLIHFFYGWLLRTLPGLLSAPLCGAGRPTPVNLFHRPLQASLQLLLLLRELLRLRQLIPVQPVQRRVQQPPRLLHVPLAQPTLHFRLVQTRLHVKDVRLQPVLCRNPLLLPVVFVLELLSIVHHAFDLFLGEPTLVVRNCDLLLLPGALLHRGHVENPVGVHVKGDLNLRCAAWRRRNAGQVKFPQQMVVLGHGSLALEYLDGDRRLVVAVGGEDLRLFGGDGGVPLDERRHHPARRLNAKRQRRHIQQEKIAHGLTLVAVENGGLNGGAVGHRLVRIDRLVQLFAVEEVLEQLLDLGNPSAAAHQHNLVDGGLVQLRVAQRLLHRLQRPLEEVGAQLFEARARDGGVEVDALEERIYFQIGLGRGGESSLGPLASGAQAAQGPLVAADILLVLPLKFVHEVVHHPAIEKVTK
jgi:hypothetical protein